MSIISKQLGIVTRFSKDMGMHFGEDKWAHLCIEKGTTVKSEPTEINKLKLQPIDEGNFDNISYNGMLNKEKVTREYLNRVRKT